MRPDAQSIAADLERERQALAADMARLRQRLTVPHVTREVVDAIVDRAQPLLEQADRTIRAHPLTLAAIGAGVAWLLVGRARRSAPFVTPAAEAMMRWEDEGGNPAPPDDERWIMETDALRARARAALRAIDDTVAGGGIPDAVAQAERANILKTLAEDSARTLRLGLDALPRAAQDRVAEARETLYIARVSGQAEPHPTIDKPILTGLLAAVCGAAVAALVPTTDDERRALAAERDQHLHDLSRSVIRDLKAMALAALL